MMLFKSVLKCVISIIKCVGRYGGTEERGRKVREGGEKNWRKGRDIGEKIR